MNNIKIFFMVFFLSMTLSTHAKPIFLGDSITYQIVNSYKKHRPVDAEYLVGSGLNNQFNFSWIEYAKTLDVSRYECVYLLLGTNDFIENNEIVNYRNKAIDLIRELKKKNRDIIWILPPTIRNERKNFLLNNTREAIKLAAVTEQITTIDMRETFGQHYMDSLNGRAIRTNDGIHITEYGADVFTQIHFINL
ncbi:SGNH/GDSL hydrolase family protein [Xenorhabdus sp. KJ12.1]|uniref:SGNH/GDSL hydrolase family protein n=1 Tax=Xenorhabdus sp. KJ12.1 TaxID=1851571 RepID=UPI000C0517FF|nr:SGNH/GDSL hydrolase family protein [Xenorhabdus sp. KJ12.1]PHM72175.1 hypothetical protein Xekj_00453 [Xenorhabdus sp. KJ12.1]